MNYKKRFLAGILALLLIATPIFSVYADNAIIGGEAEGIQSGATYVLKNKLMETYLTVPGYMDVTDENEPHNNVYQGSVGINDQYSRAVTITYDSESGAYNISPLLFKNILTGGIVSNESGNVVYEQTNNTEYNWIIIKVSENTYKILDENNKAMTCYGMGSGDVSDTEPNRLGNIYVSDYTGSPHQQWILESITVNPHILKSSVITKKNLGTDAEWLFKFSDTEMDDITILDVSVTNPECVSFDVVGNYIVVRMNAKKYNGQNIADYDEYSIITVELEGGSKRRAVIQDAGTGNNDACITKPFFPLEGSVENGVTGPYLHNVTLDGNKTQNIILTFKSGITLSGTTEWSVEDPNVTPHDPYPEPAAEKYKTDDDREVSDNNFIIISIKKVGVVIVTAKNNNCTYKMAIVINKQTNNGMVYYENVIDWYQQGGDEFSLEYNNTYIFVNNISSPIENWFLYNNQTNAQLLLHGSKFAIVSIGEEPYDVLTGPVIGSRTYTFNLVGAWSDMYYDSVCHLGNTSSLYLSAGYYYIKSYVNSEYLDCSKSDSNIITKNGNGSKEQTWYLDYLGNGYYCIRDISLERALTSPTNYTTDSNSNVTLENCVWEPVSDIPPTQQWLITTKKIKKNNDNVTVYLLQNRYVTSLQKTAYLNCDTGLFVDNVNVSTDTDGEYHYWTIEKPSFLVPGNDIDPNDQALIDFEEWVGGTKNQQEKINQAIQLVSETCYVPGNISEYGIIVYIDAAEYYHYTLPYSDGSSGSVTVYETKVPDECTMVAFIHTHFGHHDNIIFNDIELPSEYDNYVIDDGGCVYYAEKGQYGYEITTPIIEGSCYNGGNS